MKTYTVKFWGGGGGWFVQQLIAWSETQTDQVEDFPLGHAHNMSTHFRYQQMPFRMIDYNDWTAIIKASRESDSFGMINIVSTSPADVALHEFNHFYKNQIYEPTSVDFGFRQFVTRPIDNWRDLTTSEVERILEQLTEQRWSSPHSSDCRHSLAYNRLNHQLQIPNRELTITQVMTAGQELLTAVAELTGKPITPAMVTLAQRYSLAQRQLRSRFPAYNNLISRHPEWSRES